MTILDALGSIGLLHIVWEMEAAQEAKAEAERLANTIYDTGDSAKGAKLFQVSYSRRDLDTIKKTNRTSRPAALSATPSRPTVPTRSAPSCTVCSAVSPVRSRATPTPTPTRVPVSPGTRTLW